MPRSLTSASRHPRLGCPTTDASRAIADLVASGSATGCNFARTLDTTRQKTEAMIEQLEAATQPPKPKDAAAAVYAGEIRAALLRMTPAERTKTINAAINDGDDAFVGAAVTDRSRY